MLARRRAHGPHRAVLAARAKLSATRALNFLPGDPPSDEELASLVESIRHKTLRRFMRLGVLGPEAVAEMLAWRHSGFSVHAGTVAPRPGVTRECIAPFGP